MPAIFTAAIVWATMMFTIVCIILNEEIFGTYRTPHLPQVVGANLSWLLFPILIVWRVGGSAHPFTVPVAAAESAPTADAQPSSPATP